LVDGHKQTDTSGESRIVESLRGVQVCKTEAMKLAVKINTTFQKQKLERRYSISQKLLLKY